MKSMFNEAAVYQRIGTFVVAFQSLESQIREIGWFILDPGRRIWPPTELRGETTAVLFSKVERLFLDALPRCNLRPELEQEFRESFAAHAIRFRDIRRARNKILHSAFVALTAGDEVHGLMRSDPRLEVDSESGELLFDQEMLSDGSFEFELREMAELGIFFGRCHLQLIHRFPVDGDKQ
ncbi:MAG: hypothetical protein QM775_01490 [Pirellulales bacterium]